MAASASGAWILAWEPAVPTQHLSAKSDALMMQAWARPTRSQSITCDGQHGKSRSTDDQPRAVLRRLLSSSYWSWNFGAFLFSRLRFDNFH